VLGDLVLMKEVLRGFAAFDDPQIPHLILGRYGRLEPSAREVAIATLAARPASARQLLKAIADGRIEPSAISAFHARQIRSFKNQSLDNELTKLWGALRDTSEEKIKRIAELSAALSPEILQSANSGNGRLLFEKTCSNCHVLYGAGGCVGPDLTGSNRQNLNYLLENIVDPSASVGQEFQASAIVLNDGRVVTGVVVAQSDRTLEVQTEKERLVINRSDVEEVVNQKMSLMPDGLLKQLKPEQIRDLFAYLTSRSQVPVPSKP
jgi:putative heme-binding domain-containing protein